MTAIDTHAGPAAGLLDRHPEHPPVLAHHFGSPQQQFEAGKLGMWLFLATEFLLFGGLFCAYAVNRFNHPELFHYGSRFLDTRWGAINTIVLIASSMTMAMAVNAAQLGRRQALIALLSLTFLGGAGFMGIKYVEYKHKIDHHFMWGTMLYVPSAHDAPAAARQAPAASADAEEPAVRTTLSGFPVTGSNWKPASRGPGGLAAAAAGGEHHGSAAAEADAEPDPRTDPERPANAHIFFGLYFLMTGLHGLHVLAGMGVILWLIVRALRGHFGPRYFTPVDLGGLYWHVVDMIWIFLFPLLYLIG